MARTAVDTAPPLKPLPTTRELLQHYLPPQPTTSTVAKTEAGHANLLALQKDTEAALGRASQLVRARLVDVQTAAIDGNSGQLEAAVRAAVAADDEMDRCRRALDVVRRAEYVLYLAVNEAAQRDPEYRAWRARCERVGRAWHEAQMAPSGINSAERERYIERSLQGFRAEFG